MTVYHILDICLMQQVVEKKWRREKSKSCQERERERER